MKRLPIGVQEFAKMITGNYLYVDKTEYIYRLIDAGAYYFLSRPRRFGKSLLIQTLKELFLGRQDLFEGLWIYDKIDWQPHPVILLDFSEIGAKEVGLTEAINKALDDVAQAYQISLIEKTNALKFRELIRTLAQQHQKQVVILVDEYDKPIIDHIEEVEKAITNREILKNLYSVVKGNDQYIKFFMVTGISKFTQVSIFSDLNNLNDITFNSKYAPMLGYTQAELEQYFQNYLPRLLEKYAAVYVDGKQGKQAIREWYNGYSWDGETFLYNPFSILNLFENLRFADYWFKTATPTFLMKLIRQKQYTAFELENRRLNFTFFNKYDIDNIEINSLLFQTGYLTIKAWDLVTNVVTLDFPNKEVSQSFSAHLLAEFNQKSAEQTGGLLFQIQEALTAGNVGQFIALMQAMFANVTYPNVDNADKKHPKEKYYHTIFYLALKLLGYAIESEVMTIDGRIDATLHTSHYIYILEFKMGDAQSALAQIKAKHYQRKYMATGKEIVLLGIGFDDTIKNIGEFLSEIVMKE